MPAEFISENGETTIRMEWTLPTGQISNIANDAAEYLFDIGRGDHGTDETPVVYADLSNQDRLDILFAETTANLLNAAASHYSNSQQAAAKEAAEAEAAERYGL